MTWTVSWTRTGPFPTPALIPPEWWRWWRQSLRVRTSGPTSTTHWSRWPRLPCLYWSFLPPWSWPLWGHVSMVTAVRSNINNLQVSKQVSLGSFREINNCLLQENYCWFCWWLWPTLDLSLGPCFHTWTGRWTSSTWTCSQFRSSGRSGTPPPGPSSTSWPTPPCGTDSRLLVVPPEEGEWSSIL